MEHRPVSLDKDEQDDDRKYIADIQSCPFRELKPFSGVGFLGEIFPAPADLTGAE